MQFRTFPLALIAASALFASADKTLPIEKTSNDFVEISGTLLSKEEIVKTFGSDLGGQIVVVRTTVRPLSDKPVKIDYDDFFLMDTDNGERSEPYEPTQIAGSSVLVVTPTGARTGMSRGPSFGIGGIGMGTGNTNETVNNTKVETHNEDKANPVLDKLKQNILPEKSVTDPITGLLYFQIDGKKIKAKSLEMHYKTPSGRISMRFRPS